MVSTKYTILYLYIYYQHLNNKDLLQPYRIIHYILHPEHIVRLLGHLNKQPEVSYPPMNPKTSDNIHEKLQIHHHIRESPEIFHLQKSHEIERLHDRPKAGHHSRETRIAIMSAHEKKDICHLLDDPQEVNYNREVNYPLLESREVCHPSREGCEVLLPHECCHPF